MKRVYTIQENGQITLPADWREKYNLKQGDVVTFLETANGLLISPKRLLAAQLMDELGTALKEAGVSLEEMLEATQATRQEIAEEDPPASRS